MKWKVSGKANPAHTRWLETGTAFGTIEVERYVVTGEYGVFIGGRRLFYVKADSPQKALGLARERLTEETYDLLDFLTGGWT